MTDEQSITPEVGEILHPEEIFILSPISQPQWYPGEIDYQNKKSLSDKIRGDLILENLKKAKEIGYSVVLVYSGRDNQKFIHAMSEIQQEEGEKENPKTKRIVIKKCDIEGYSQARREAIWEARQPTSGCKAIVMLELEKPLLEHVPSMVLPILNGIADVTITDRGIKSSDEISDREQEYNEDLRGLPRYQARSENSFNNWANSLLKENGLMPLEFPKIDWMGNRAWKNDSLINEIFLVRYGVSESGPELNINPDHLSASLFFPIAAMLYKNMLAEKSGKQKIRILSVPIDYLHPKEQSNLENNSPNFIRKRDEQREMLMREMIEFVRLIKSGPSHLTRPGLKIIDKTS